MKLIVYKNGKVVEEREITQPIFLDCTESFFAVYPSGKQWTVYDDDDDFGVSCFDANDDNFIIETNANIEKEVSKEIFMQHYDHAMKLLLGVNQ